MAFQLPSLNYAADALSPHIGEKTVTLHHTKHLQAYVDNTNKLIAGSDYENLDLVDLIQKAWKDKNQGLINNAGQLFNHSLYFAVMSPKGGKLTSKVESKINADFGSFAAFREAFIQAGMTQFGSGWAWLVLNNDNGKLEICKTLNGESPVMHGKNVTPLVGCDVWEHAYYLDYQNRRLAYLEAFVDSLIDWNAVEAKL